MIRDDAATFAAKLFDWLASDSKGRPQGIRARAYAMIYVLFPDKVERRTIAEMGAKLGMTARGFRKHVLSFEETFNVKGPRLNANAKPPR